MVDRREFRFEFPCPGCQARLRLKDRSLIGTLWNCPECKTSLEIRDAGQGNLVASIAADTSKSNEQFNRRGITPQAAAALVAITLITGLAVFVLWVPEPAALPSVVQPVENLPVPPIVTQIPVEAFPDSIDPVESQLSALGKWLKGHHEKTGAFPSAVSGGDLPAIERLGWLAQYREDTELSESVHPNESLGWRDPANEPFVRRRATALLNPRVTAVASEDGFPATHFVGVAGVGADADVLPKIHPRAGVFGIDRRTTRDDIKDGTTNTFLVMGVETHPPAWASGIDTVRGLTAEPYFGGPDQFGTGQSDGMQVLMADGSVRFLSKDTDPKLMRRMATMADGLPLDANVPGEPTDPVKPSTSIDVAQNNTPAANEPISVEVTPEPVGYDVDKGLSLAVSKFELKTPTPLRTLLRQVVEMSALPIDTSLVQNDPRLDQLISLDLKDTTLRGILVAALAQAQLEFTGDLKGIHLRSGATP